MYEHLKEKTLKKETVYEGNFITVERRKVLLPDGKEKNRDIVLHPGAVAILPLTKEDDVIFVRQYRNALDRVFLEIPAGKIERGEDPRNTAERELMEEIGLKGEHCDLITEMIPSPGFLTEKIYLFKAENLIPEKREADDDEFIDLERIPFTDAIKMVKRGEITDGKTIAALLLEKLHREER